VTLLSSMSTQGMGPSLAVEGSTTREVFEAYLAQVLGPTLWPGQVVVMDNLSAHKGERVKGADRGAGLRANVPATLLAQPQIHRASVLEIKGLLRKAEARTREALVEAMGRAISAITPRDAEGYFEHRGYRLVAQQLCDKRSRILSLRSRAGNQ
jgi:DDE superfamily endonuclease